MYKNFWQLFQRYCIIKSEIQIIYKNIIMTKFLTFDLNTAYSEIKQKAQQEAVTTKEAWDSYVDDYINKKINIGELDSDQDTEGIIKDLQAKWTAYQDNINIR